MNIKKRDLGSTGIQVSEYGLGAWALGGEGKILNYGDVSEQEAVEVLEGYVNGGGNYIDTARAYNECEKHIGCFLKHYGKRENLVISTKTVAGQNADTLSAIRKDLETSLGLMNIDYVDVLFLHQPPEDDDTMNRALDILQELKTEGKIRAAGASIKGVDVTDKTVKLCNAYMETKKCDVIQLVYSILRQRHRSVIDDAYKLGVGIVVRTCLESGLLTGKYKPGHAFTGKDQRSRYAKENLEFILSTVGAMEKRLVRTPYQSLSEVAIKFAMVPKGTSSVIIGARTKTQVERNLSVARLPDLSEDLIKTIVDSYGDITDKANYS